MTAVANILCPIDWSDISRRALRTAVMLAQAHDARLTIVEVVETGRVDLRRRPSGAHTRRKESREA